MNKLYTEADRIFGYHFLSFSGIRKCFEAGFSEVQKGETHGNPSGKRSALVGFRHGFSHPVSSSCVPSLKLTVRP